ncbi:ATP-binding protein [Candidatus Micrarchaeota archaeon]|nr:ATP-binding protein [Candidatus Micrarchaeota archaeon]
MDFEKLAEQNPWWKDKAAVEKDYDVEKWRAKRFKWTPKFIGKLPLDSFSLHVLVGPRQTGKTTAVKLLVRKLLKENDARSVFYLDCEPLAGFEELMEAMEAYMHYRENCGIKKSFILLDEVSAPKEWFRGVKALIDRGKLKNDVLLLTGSSSMAVKRQVELFPGRRGNGKDVLLLPLSFREFLKVVNPKLHDKIQPTKSLDELEQKATTALPYISELNKELSRYMKYGGFPLSVEALDGNNEEAKRACLSWVKTAVLKAERSDVIARQIVGAFVEKMPSAISWEGVSKELEIKSPKTVSAYTDLLKSLYAIMISYNVDVNDKNVLFGKNKKIHLADPLLLEVFENWSLRKAKNRESVIAESLAATHLSRLFPEKVFFWKNGFEVDAVVMEKNSLYGFEVKWTEKPAGQVKSLPQFKKTFLLNKKGFTPGKNPVMPLAVFLSMLEE